MATKRKPASTTFKIYVRERNIKTKAKYIRMLGGKCNRCGYSRCVGAFDFHHIGQSKEVRLHEYYLKRFEQKVKDGKIMLLCANCHRELHYMEHHALMLRVQP